MLEPTADLCETLMELPHTAGLMELALIRRELGEVDDESPETYSGPCSSMKLAQARHHHDPWPIIEAIRAPSWEIVEAAARLGISVKGWVEGSTEVVERARFLFPDFSPLKVGLVVLSAGLVCARTEFEVKAVVGRAIPGLSPGSPGSTIDGFWPEAQPASLAAEARRRVGIWSISRLISVSERRRRLLLPRLPPFGELEQLELMRVGVWH